MICSVCGTVNREGAKFCNHCGKRMPIIEPNQPVPAPQTSKSRVVRILNELKWLIVIYLILSLCCGSTAFFLGFRTNWILWKLGLR
jgi:hypothetical protein